MQQTSKGLSTQEADSGVTMPREGAAWGGHILSGKNWGGGPCRDGVVSGGATVSLRVTLLLLPAQQRPCSRQRGEMGRTWVSLGCVQALSLIPLLQWVDQRDTREGWGEAPTANTPPCPAFGTQVPS